MRRGPARIGIHRHLTIRSSRPHVVASATCFTLRLHVSAAPPRVGLTQALDRAMTLNNRQAFSSISGGALAVVLLWATVRFLPAVGSVVYFPTIIALEALEDTGLSTLKGSPDGWPIPTTLGLVISGIAWWAICTLAILALLHFRLRRSKSIGRAI